MKELVMFITRECPICFRLKQMLVPLVLENALHLTVVDIEAVRRGSYVDKYRYFINSVLGGEKHTPILLLGEERWYIPKRTTREGERGEFTEEEIDKACREVVEKIKKDLRHEEKVYPPTHRMMRTKYG